MGSAGASSFAGDIHVTANSGFVSGGANPAVLTLSGHVTLDGNLNVTGAVQITGPVNGSGALAMGAGTLTLSGANSYQGVTTIDGGTIKLGADNAIPYAGAVTLGPGSTGSFSVLDLNGFNDTIGSLAASSSGTATVHLRGGTLKTGANNS